MRLRLTGLAIIVPLAFAACTTAAPTSDQSDTAGTTSPSTQATPAATPTTDAEMISSAMAAAPDAVSRDATIVAFNDAMEMRTLREGTNGWTCMPDLAHTPGTDPMCLDQAGMAWAGAWMAHVDPPADTMGFGYMLMGGSDASNTDPFATEPAVDDQWVDTGAHVMIFNIGANFPGYPTTADDTSRPFVMFAGTPYAHLMIPVK